MPENLVLDFLFVATPVALIGLLYAVHAVFPTASDTPVKTLEDYMREYTESRE